MLIYILNRENLVDKYAYMHKESENNFRIRHLEHKLVATEARIEVLENILEEI